MDVEIPDKLYFRIGEVADLTGIKPHVLRYWESEFGSFRPTKNRSRQRLYRRKDIELVLRIKDLLYNQGFTIAGAQKVLREKTAPSKEGGAGSSETSVDRKLLGEIRSDLKRLRRRLDSYPPGESDPS